MPHEGNRLLLSPANASVSTLTAPSKGSVRRLEPAALLLTVGAEVILDRNGAP
jgi:hypothetical protein